MPNMFVLHRWLPWLLCYVIVRQTVWLVVAVPTPQHSQRNRRRSKRLRFAFLERSGGI